MIRSSSSDEWSILLNGMADNQLTEEQEGRLVELLRTDDEFRREYVLFCQLQSQLAWQLSADASVEVTAGQASPIVPTSTGRRLFIRWSPWIATALIVMVAINWLGVRESTKEPVAHLVGASGRVRVVRDGKAPFWIHPDEITNQSKPLHPGDRIQSDRQSFAIVLLADETQLRIRPRSEVVLFPRSAGGIEVPSGSISAKVTPQNPREPLTFFTPNSEVQVIGTELELLSRSEQSEVAVMEGTVRVTRSSDGSTTTVSTGQFLAVTESQPLSLVNWPRRPDFWNIDFENGLSPGWQGQFEENRLPDQSLGAARSVKFRRGSGATLHVQSPYDRTGLFSWQDDSVLELTFKVQPPGWFHIYLIARTYDANQPLLTYCYVDADLWQTHPGQWRTVSIPLSEFHLQNVTSEAPTLGRIPVQIAFRGESESAGFLIDRIWVNRGDELSTGSRKNIYPPDGARSR